MPNRQDFLRKFRQELADDDHLTHSQVIALLHLRLGLEWTWWSLEAAIKRGLPFHQHPYSHWKGRKAFSWSKVVAWLEREGVLPHPKAS